MARINAIEHRTALLAEKLKSRKDNVRDALVQPRPYKQIKVSEEDQVRKFLQIKETGGLNPLREQLGDEAVNNYVQAMQGRAQKYLNLLAERENTSGKEITEADTKRPSGEPVATYYTADDDLESF